MIEYQPTLPIFRKGKQICHSRPNSSLHIKRNSHFSEEQQQLNQHKERLRSRQSQKILQQYEQTWENQLLKRLAQDIYQETQLEQARQIEYQGDRLPRQIATKITDKHIPKFKRKDLEKYSAYAVKMKIPSFQDICKIKHKESKQPTKAAISTQQLRIIEDLIHPKLSIINQNALKEHFLRFDSISNQIEIPRREVKTSAKQRKAGIRKRSLKTKDKRTEREVNEVVRKIESNYSRYTPISAQGSKRMKAKFQKESIKMNEPSRTADTKEEQKEFFQNIDKGSPRNSRKLRLQNTDKSPKYETRKQIASVSPNRSFEENPVYLQQGISFKKKKTQIRMLEQKKLELAQKEYESDIIRQKSPRVNSKSNKNQSRSKEKPQVSHEQSPFIQSANESPSKNIKKKARDFLKNREKGFCELQKKQSKDLCSPSPVKPHRKGRILVFNSEDKYIKRILLDNNWVLNPDSQSHYYNLKWVFKPIPQDYNNLTEKQFLNHIKNTHELTSKNYLNKNLKQYLPQWPSLYQNYPKCYDFSKTDQKNQFHNEYIKNFMMLLLRKIFNYFLEKRPSEVHIYKAKYQKLLQLDGTYDIQSKFYSPMRKKQFRNIDFQNFKWFNSNFTVHVNCIILALKYWRHLRKNEELQTDQHYHYLTYNSKELQLNWNHLQEYSRSTTMTFNPENESNYFIKEYFSTPSNLMIQRIVKEYVYFERNLGKEWKTFGDKNVWIIKPCSASRGNGIYLQSNSNQILYNSKGIQSKIVQKYIERPLLFSSPLLRNKKFDIRQWVLLHSVNPLQIYIFSHCYIRICSQEYQINNIHNLKSHLTNYTFNKKNFKDSSESVMDYDTFKNLLKEECSIDYQEQIKPKIKEIIVNSIKAGQEHLHDLNKRCFSLLGYDILLDQECNPWLLQINMSPACQERTQWLKQYLRNMGDGMLKIVLPRQYWQNNEMESSQLTSKYLRDRSVKKEQKRCQMNRIRTELSQQLSNQEKISMFPREVIDPRNQDEEVIEMSNDIAKSQNNMGKSSVSDKMDPFFDSDQEDWERIDTLDFEDAFKENKDQEQKTEIDPKIFQKKDPNGNEQNKNQGSPQQYQRESESNKIQSSFKWELICSEEYYMPSKKDPQNFEVVGSKFSIFALKRNDINLDQYEEARDHVDRSVLSIQKMIRSFLVLRSLKRQKKIEQFESQQKFVINFSRMGRNFSEKDSRSIGIEENLSGSSIWHYNYYHTYREHTIEKRYIEQSNHQLRKSYRQLKSRGSPEHKLKDKIKSYISEASCQDVQEIILNDDKRKERMKTESLQMGQFGNKQVLSHKHFLRSVQFLPKEPQQQS